MLPVSATGGQCIEYACSGGAERGMTAHVSGRGRKYERISSTGSGNQGDHRNGIDLDPSPGSLQI